MILVDTSVWVRFLHNYEPFRSELKTLLDQEHVIGHPFVFGELLIADPGGRLEILDGYTHMEQARTVAHDEIVTLVRSRRLFGRGVGWVDLHILASAIAEGFQLWTADQRLEELASAFGIAYALPGPSRLKIRHSR